jgi:hypothetical protein
MTKYEARLRIGVYFLVKDCSFFCSPIQNGIAYAVNNFFFLELALGLAA